MSRRLELVAILALVFAYVFLVQPSGDNQKAHLALVRALADGVPYVDEQVRSAELASVDTTRFEGHLYAAKAPGLAFFTLPFYAALDAAGADLDGEPSRFLWALHLWGAVLPAVALLLLVRWVGDLFEPGLGIAAAVVLGGATLVLPFATLYFSHVLAATLGFAAFALLLRERRGPPSVTTVALAGLVAGLGVTVEYPLGLGALALFAYAISRGDRLSRALAFGAGAVVGALPALAFNQWAFGSPFRFPYEGWTVGEGAKPLPGIFGLTFPDVHALLALLFAPAGLASLSAGVVGAFLLARRGRRAECAVLVGLPVAYLLYNASFVEPFGGASPGPRYLVPALPFLAAGLAPAFRRIPGAALGLAVATGTFLAAATITSPLAAWDGDVLHRLRTGGYVRSVLDFVGVGGGVADLPFLLALGVAAAIGFAAVRPYLRRPDAAAFVLALGGWTLIASQSHRLLNDPSTWTYATALLIAPAVAGAIAWVYRRAEVVA
jgi:hypothetical protein